MIKTKSVSTPSVANFFKSTWFFPVVLTIILISLTVLKVSGSSIGEYYSFFYGATAKDPALILNKPQSIRSDEWVVNTQMTVAQKNAGYTRINKNIGHGEDVSLIVDVPYKEWSTVFKPHNLAFFVMPFDNAFAFKWWFMAYLLILSCYFFVLTIMPKRKLLAVFLSIALLASPFVQWWYQYITLGPIYYTLFSAAIFIRLVRQKELAKSIAWGILLVYTITCLALVLYPPFQIACILAALPFLIGIFIQQRRLLTNKVLVQKSVVLLGVLLLAGAITLSFFTTRSNVIHRIENTAYPGERLQASGGFDLQHLFSGNLDYQLQSVPHAQHYLIPKDGLMNQSEDSNFVLLLPFLLVPAMYIIYYDYRRNNEKDWPLILVSLTFLVFMLWLFVPHLDTVGRFTLLDRVPHTRLLIGFGVLNIIQLLLVMRRLNDLKSKFFSVRHVFAYSLLIFVVEALLGRHVMHRFPGFIGHYRVLLFALPIPMAVYLTLRKHLEYAALVLLIFSVAMTARIHPLYRGTAILTETPISRAIQQISSNNNGAWAVEVGRLENFAFMSGAPSLSGVYFYPQLELWQNTGSPQYIYNRYAHTNFVFNRNVSESIPTTLVQPAADHFGIITEPCGSFIKKENVRFILTDAPIYDSCVQLVRTVDYPASHFLIYKVN